MHLDLQKNKKVLRKKRLRTKIFGSAGIVQMGWRCSDDQRIVCDVCNQPYHLQCSGIQYTILEYWTIQLDEINFECEVCERVLNDH